MSVPGCPGQQMLEPMLQAGTRQAASQLVAGLLMELGNYNCVETLRHLSEQILQQDTRLVIR